MLIEAKYDGDKVKLKHREYNGDIYSDNKELRNKDVSWMEGRSMKRLASIPPLLFAKVGHKIAPRGIIDEKALRRWLETEEGRPCLIDDDKVDPRKGKGPLIIVK